MLWPGNCLQVKTAAIIGLTHLLSSSRGHYPALPIFQCLKTVVSYNLSAFAVVTAGEQILYQLILNKNKQVFFPLYFGCAVYLVLPLL